MSSTHQGKLSGKRSVAVAVLSKPILATRCKIRSWFLKPFKGGNYSREETIQGRKLFAEIRYSKRFPEKVSVKSLAPARLI